jgi:site-specific DNA recombinase
MVVVGYARVSTENQIENYSIAEQTERLKAYCAAKGWILSKIYTDGGFSGANTNRPALQQLLEAVRAGGIDGVLVYKLDRLSRSQKDTLTLIEDEFLAHNTDFISICENFDTSTPFGRAMIGILSVFAQLEKDQITERFTMGKIGRAKAGYFQGGGPIPVGYDYVDGNLVVNEFEAAQVRQIYKLFLDGKSMSSIAKIMASSDPSPWSPRKVSALLRNNLYIGYIKFRGEEYEGLHEPILDRETFFAVQHLLSSLEWEDRKKGQMKTPWRVGYLLTGLVFCGRCGARYGAKGGLYSCYSRSKPSRKYVIDPDCKNDHWKIADLEDVVVKQCRQLCDNPSMVDSIIKGSKKEPPKVDKGKIKKEISRLDSQLSKLLDLYQLEDVPMDVLSQKVSALNAKKKALQAQLNEPEVQTAVASFLAAIEDFRDGFDTGDLDKRRTLIASIVERITINGQELEITWRI